MIDGYTILLSQGAYLIPIMAKDTYNYPNGDQYVGEFKDGKPHGQGTYTTSFGDQLEGIWEEGEFLYKNKRD